ncbi:MAG: hypothetical protein IKO05_04135 [Selenomonadaceae bacterium]|nr:hypothetical protein [Selenomonadaceae bacterium]
MARGLKNFSASVIFELNADTRGEIPKHLRDTHYKGAKTFGHGVGYKYPHDFENHFVRQQYLPDEKISARYYEPTTQGAEAAIKIRLENFWRADKKIFPPQ